jgi:hypothetical protein
LVCTNCSALQWPIHCNLQLSVRLAFAHCMTGPEDLQGFLLLPAHGMGNGSSCPSLCSEWGSRRIAQVGARGTRKLRSFLPWRCSYPCSALVRIDPCTSGVESLMELPPEQFSSAFRCTEGAWPWHSRLHSRPSTRRGATPRLEYLSAERWTVHGNKLPLNWPGAPAHLRKLNRLGTGSAPTD